MGVHCTKHQKVGVMTLASVNGELEVTQVSLRHGAAVDSRGPNGFTPLMSASRRGDVDVVQLLSQNGVDVDSRDKWWLDCAGVSVVIRTSGRGTGLTPERRTCERP